MRIILWIICMVLMTSFSHANTDYFSETKLSLKEKSIISIASLTAKGDLTLLKPSLYEALDAGLTVNEAKEVLLGKVVRSQLHRISHSTFRSRT